MKPGHIILTVVLLALVLLPGACRSAPATSQTTPVAPATVSTTTSPPALTTPYTVPSVTTPSVTTSEKPTAPTKTETSPPSETTPVTIIAPDFAETMLNHFGFMPAQWDFAAAGEAGGAFDRPFFELFRWDMIEREPGFFDFSETDRYVREAQEHGLHILANIQPFAVWDQAACHGPQPTGPPVKGGLEPTKGKPCDMDAYCNFVKKLVERYDGDGIDDMPGLTMPIKHWELMNEPEFQTEPIYFQGTPAEYAEVLRATWETVKQADTEAFIVQGVWRG